PRRRHHIDGARRVVIAMMVMGTPAVRGRPVRRIGEREAREAERYGGEEDLFQHGHLRFLIAMSISRAAAPEVNRESARGVTACYFSRPRRKQCTEHGSW